MASTLVPYVIEQTPQGEKKLRHLFAAPEGKDYFPGRRSGRCFRQRYCSAALFLESEDPSKDISLYINSPGGSVTAGWAIYDTMQYIKCDVSTICIGMAASMGRFCSQAALRERGRLFRTQKS